MSELKARIQEDMKAALRAGDKQRLGALRLILAAIKQRMKDMGKVMAALRPKVQGRTDMAQLSALIRERLSR